MGLMDSAGLVKPQIQARFLAFGGFLKRTRRISRPKSKGLGLDAPSESVVLTTPCPSGMVQVDLADGRPSLVPSSVSRGGRRARAVL